jgi:predicted permease
MGLPISFDLGPDLRLLAGTSALCVLATLLFGLGPALAASRPAVVNELKRDAGEAARGGALRFFAPKHLLVMAQVALSLVLLFSAGLFLRGAMNAGAIALGFDPGPGVVSELDFSLGTRDRADAQRAIARVLERARVLPGVTAAAVSTMLPFGNSTFTRRVQPASDTASASASGAKPGFNGLYTGITPGYFAALGVTLLRGRDFSAREAEDPAAPVAIVDEGMAASLFPGGDALGKRIRYTQVPADGSPAELEVIGVVKPFRHDVFSGSMQRRLFVPLAQGHRGDVFLHVRLAAAGAATAFPSTLRQMLRALDPALPVLNVRPLSAVIDASVDLWLVRLAAVMFGVFGVIALLLAAVGVYGVKSYAVSRRTREIGIRLALGAYSRQVFSLVLRQGLLQTALALAFGALLALAAGRLLARMLYQVNPMDPLVLLIAGLVLLAASLLACVVPARRAMRVSPLAALRSD